jgi:hypothetical protein
MSSPTYVPVIRTGVPVEFTNVTVTGTLAVTGASTLTGNVSMGGTLAVTGASTLTGNTTVGGTLGVTGAVALAAAVTSTRAAGTDVVLGSLVTADTFDRFRIDTNGGHSWGSGAAARNIGLSRGADNRLDLTTADLRIATAGRGLQVAEGANAKQGAATLVAGTVTVNTTAVTANSRIQLTVQSLGTVAAPKAIAVTARTAATSFTITSADATDTSVVAWTIIEPA